MKVLILLFSICFFANKTSAQSNLKQKLSALEQKLVQQYEAKKLKEAVVTLGEILKIVPYHPKHLENGFALAYDLKDTLMMIDYCKLITASQPENTTFQNYLTWFYLVQGKFLNSEKCGNSAYYHERGNSSIIMNYAHAKQALGKKEEAYNLYKESMGLLFTKNEFEKSLLEDCKLLHKRNPGLGFDLLSIKLEKEFATLLLQKKTGNDLQLELNKYLDSIVTTIDYKYLTNLNKRIIAFEIASTPVRKHFLSKGYGSLAKYAYNEGSYSQAIGYYLTAINFDNAMGCRSKMAERFVNIAKVYRTLTLYDSAGNYLNQGYAISNIDSDSWNTAQILEEFGSLNKDILKFEDAKKYYGQAMSTYKLVNNQQSVSGIHYKLGNILADEKKIDEALQNYQKALNINELYGFSKEMYPIYNGLGNIYYEKGNHEKSLEYFLKSYETGGIQLKGSYKSQITLFNNIGNAFYNLKKYDSAIMFLQKSNDLIKTVRAKLSDKAKMEFYSNNLTSLQLLSNCYIKKQQFKNALEYVEQSKSMMMSEKMGYDLNNQINIDSIRKNMKDDQVFLVYGNMNSNMKVGSKTCIAFTKTEMIGNVITDSSFIVEASKHSYGSYLDTIITRLKRFRKEGFKNGLLGKELRIFTIYYQIALANAATQKRSTIKGNNNDTDLSSRQYANALSHLLYLQLVKPVEHLLKGKRQMVILSDGNLSFLPFESLLTDENKYLGESLVVSYLPSFKVGSILAKRAENNSGKILALGNPVYEELSETNKLITPVRKLYNKDNGYNWASLPGTASEIKSIASDFKNSVILESEKAEEGSIKEMSKQGLLKNYSILHFATHGYVMTDEPDYSTLVLNQLNSNKTEDGYLTSKEIESLSIKANLVCLSACQTGQGLLKDGEGVMGLSNAFFLAGAKSTAVSMWSVSDDATSKFMSSAYHLMSTNNSSFKEALFLTRQKFIKGEFGEEYKKPFYWAPFIFYGN